MSESVAELAKALGTEIGNLGAQTYLDRVDGVHDGVFLCRKSVSRIPQNIVDIRANIPQCPPLHRPSCSATS